VQKNRSDDINKTPQYTCTIPYKNLYKRVKENRPSSRTNLVNVISCSKWEHTIMNKGTET